MSGRERFLSALAGRELAFAPIVWERLAALVHQEREGWWQDPTVAGRLMGDAAALAGADAMFVLAAGEAVRRAAASGLRGDAALDGLAGTAEAAHGVELVRCLRQVAGYGVVAGVPAPNELGRALRGDGPDAAEDAFTDLVSAYLAAGADAVAVTGGQTSEVSAGVARAAQVGALFGRPVLGVCWGAGQPEGAGPGEVVAWTEHGEPLGVISADGEWPALRAGVVITPGDVSPHWDAPRLRAVGMARPIGSPTP